MKLIVPSTKNAVLNAEQIGIIYIHKEKDTNSYILCADGYNLSYHKTEDDAKEVLQELAIALTSTKHNLGIDEMLYFMEDTN